MCERENVNIKYYSINANLEIPSFCLDKNEWLYFVNYYGQFPNCDLIKLKEKYDRIIVDNVQAYFQEPVPGIDTLYSCRKYFGVPDGAFVYCDRQTNEEFEQDCSFTRMEYLLHGVDYAKVGEQRNNNFRFLHTRLCHINRLHLHSPIAPYMYPLYISNGDKVREKMLNDLIYIPTLWTDVVKDVKATKLEKDMAMNILPLPIDQRYTEKEMDILVDRIFKYSE